MYVWILISHNNLLSLSDSQIIVYYLLSIVVLRLIQFWFMEDLGQKIKDGFMSIMIFRGILLVDRFPTSLHPTFVRFIFTFIIPIAIIFTLPAHIITGQELSLIIAGTIISLMVIIFTRIFWHYSIRQYSSASS